MLMVFFLLVISDDIRKLVLSTSLQVQRELITMDRGSEIPYLVIKSSDATLVKI